MDRFSNKKNFGLLTGKQVFGSNNENTRQNWLRKTLSGIPSGLRILDVGAGECRNKVFCSHLDYVSQDFCQYGGLGNKKGLQTGAWDTSLIDIICDLTNIPEPDESFDVILCSEVLEHVPDPIKALHELNRLLKKGGTLIITAPFCSLTHFAPYHYYSGFNRYFYEQHLERFGLKITELSTNGNFFEYLAQELLRIPTAAKLYSGRKLWKIEKLLVKSTLLVLKRLAAADNGSNELLCFGYHIVANKH